MPDFSVEQSILEHAIDLLMPPCAGLIAGVDEAGRGPWAGPVVAAVVIFPDLKISKYLAENLNDSKKISTSKRKHLFEKLHESGAFIGVGQASVQEIDELNILQATFLAMRRAIADLPVPPVYALVDGNREPPEFPCPVRTLVKGDALSLSVAAASIVAKVTRDKIMADLAQQFPFYAWEKNAGYGTAAHEKGLRDYGICVHHRKSFEPIKKFLENG